MIKIKGGQDLFLSFKMRYNLIDDLGKWDIKEAITNCTIGFFDGVHLGHQKLLQELEKKDGTKAIITFDNTMGKELIYTEAKKLSLLSKYDIDEIIIIKTNKLNLNYTYNFFNSFLLKLQIKNIILGEDFHYGKDVLGTTKTLKNDFNVKVLKLSYLDNIKISSTIIRNELKLGNLNQVNKNLGRIYSIEGIVKKGKQIGRTINFPTCNVIPINNLLKLGIYQTITIMDEEMHHSITNIGTRPTIDDNQKVIMETNIFNFNKECYGKRMEVYFISYIREIKKFNSLEELKEQIHKDVIVAKNIKGEI